MPGDQSSPGMRILLFGATGFVGAHLLHVLAVHGLVTGVYRSKPSSGAHRSLYSPDPIAEVDSLFRRVRPHLVVNAAALASIGACEEEPERAARVNAHFPGVLALAADMIGARLVHLSTDQVFDGLDAPYDEDSPPSPISVYGETKRAGEAAVLGIGGNALIVRLNLLYGPSRAARLSWPHRSCRFLPR
jgi:dTDP-4-dehydrorhamnose reductase